MELARQPVRRGTTVPVVGWEGGAGRTTVTRLLSTAFAHLRGEHAVVVDAVPMWGGLTAGADQPGDYCPSDVATMSWPIEQPVMAKLMTTIDGMPLLAGPSPIRGVLADPAATLEAVRRIASLARLTFVDTVADAAGAPASRLIRDPNSTVVWVSSATRSGLWGTAEALTYYRAVGAEHIARRSVVAVVGGGRRWPAEAAAAEAQLAGLGVETVRVPHRHKPLTDGRCRASAERLLAAVVARSR
jgi:MinD-like ATPase involved in chromosome partitioning or flagellar assembly